MANKIVFWRSPGDWFDISASDFLPTDVTFPSVDLTFPNIGVFDSLDAAWRSIQPRIDRFNSIIKTIPFGIKDQYSSLLYDLMMNHTITFSNLIPGIIPDDYNPPKYAGTIVVDIDPKEELKSYTEMSDVSTKELHFCLASLFRIS